MGATRVELIADTFNRRGYAVIRNAVRDSLVGVLERHVRRVSVSALPDDQVPNAPAVSCDPLLEQLLEDLLVEIEQNTARRLFPTYSYCRVYTHGDVLNRHRDRSSCEISLSLCLGYDSDEPWPLLIEGSTGTFSAELEPGDALLYKGTEYFHWRDAFHGTSAVQAFLHYVDQAGPFKEWRFDKRPNLNLPADLMPNRGLPI
jgi:hypothetical protein